jgi:hypothetical protein
MKLENLKFQCHLQGKARVQSAPATLAVNGHGFILNIFHWYSHPITLQTTLTSQTPPPTHQATLLIQIHILASLIKFNLENSESQVYLQGKARVNPAPTTLAVNGHGFILNIFQ